MKMYLKILFIVFGSFVIFGFHEESNSGFTLKVKVDHLRNNKGVVQFALYNRAGSIPDENYEKYYKKKTVKIHRNKALVIFDNLKPDVYAVNILHDENKNSKIDKGWVLPVEGIGFSNYKSIGLTNRPNFSNASFEVGKNKTVAVKVIYM